MNKQNQKRTSTSCFYLISFMERSKEIIFFFSLRGGPCWDSRTQVHWLIAVYLSFKFIGGYLVAQPPYRGPQLSLTSFLRAPDPFWQSPRSTSLSFPTPGRAFTQIVYQHFPFLRQITCMREAFALLILRSIYCRLIRPVKSPRAFCNVSYPVYL